ncbi:hypothetical protein KV557_09830 [Kitasatospora aureofaciens]|uniref:hypothetical protein n=1 Tax=Kitasatospora aureofaciens TaxID=1894 RepID=UPI001C4868F9|nr:hypothetical protein [Kitasatospora aureofaciens]MBV6697422.1 hypothetical protein [Kitasatospora aureofaciens]
MSTDIYSHTGGRTIATYPLLTEVQTLTGLNRDEAHNFIHATLDQLIAEDGEENVVVSQRPDRPGLLANNPLDLTVDHWTTITDDAAEFIRATATEHAE